MKILLISGHGAGDSGAIGNGYKEADLTRELVNLIASKLRKYASVDVYNQKRNAFDDIQTGTFKIGKYDYALEVHFNAFKKSASDGKKKGSEIYVTTREHGITVEKEIMKNMKKYFPLRDNDSVFDGVKRTNFLVINTLKNKGISASLLETCFIDDPDDMKQYQESKNNIAQGIVNGIVKGFGLKEKQESGSGSTDTKPSGKLYRVQTGAFRNKKNAEALASKLKSNGFSTYIVNEGGLFKVQTGAYSKKDNAVNLQKKLKAKGFDSFIKNQ